IPLVHHSFRCGAGVHGYANERGAKYASVKEIARLKGFKDNAVFVLGGFGAVHGLVEMRVELLADGVEALDAEAREIFEQLLVDQLEALAVIFVFGFAVGSEGVFEAVDDRNERFDDAADGALGGFRAFFFDSLAVIDEVGLVAKKRLLHLLELGAEFFGIGVFAGEIGVGGLGFAFAAKLNFYFLLVHGSPFPCHYYFSASGLIQSC